MNLTRFESDSIELYINTVNGESFATVTGYAKMSSKAKSTISERFGKIDLAEAQIETTTGVKTVRLITESLICEWLPKDNPEMASKLMKLGVRMFLHELAGYKVSSTAITVHQDNDRLFAKQFIDSMYADIAERYPEIDKRLIDGAKLNGYGRHYPELKGEVEEVKHLISATSSEEKLPMSPTELGVRFAQEHCLLKVSAQKVNQALLIEGLQEKSGDKLCPYQLTSLGEEYGELQLETCKGHNKTVYRIRWYEEVISLIEDTLLKLVKTKKVIKEVC